MKFDGLVLGLLIAVIGILALLAEDPTPKRQWHKPWRITDRSFQRDFVATLPLAILAALVGAGMLATAVIAAAGNPR